MLVRLRMKVSCRDCMTYKIIGRWRMVSILLAYFEVIKAILLKVISNFFILCKLGWECTFLREREREREREKLLQEPIMGN